MEQINPEIVIAKPLYSNKCNICQKLFYTSSNPGTANHYRCEECIRIDKNIYFRILFCNIQ